MASRKATVKEVGRYTGTRITFLLPMVVAHIDEHHPWRFKKLVMRSAEYGNLEGIRKEIKFHEQQIRMLIRYISGVMPRKRKSMKSEIKFHERQIKKLFLSSGANLIDYNEGL